MPHTICDVLDAKGRGVVSIHPSAPVAGAVALMDQRTVGSVLAVDGDILRGILTEKDVLHRLVNTHRDPRTTLVGDLMTREVHFATTDMPVDEAMRMMIFGAFDHLPVVEDGLVRGLVSSGDLVKWVALDLERHLLELHILVAGPAVVPDLPPIPSLGGRCLNLLKA